MKSRNRFLITQCLLLLLSLSWGAAVQAQKVAVTEAVPDNAEQGTISLDVKIKGRGFANGAVVRFLLPDSETEDGGVFVNSVTVNDSKNLTANITIDDAAAVDFRDIEVENTNGRKGKGITLFSVKEKGGGNQTDACLTSTTFPTFVYWDNSDNLDRMTLSDAEGACLVELLAHDNQHYFLGNSAMHFENGLGRIVWTDRWPGNEIYLTEFSVGPGNAVNVVYERSLLAALPHHEDNHGSLMDVDISPDGQSMTFIYASPNAPGAGEAEYTCIYSGSIDNWRLGTWVPAVGPDPCDESNEVVSFGPYPNGDGPHLTDIMYSADGSRILYDVSGFNGWNPGTYVIDSSDGNWILPPVYRPGIIFPWDTAFIDPGDGGGTRELLLVGPGSDSVNYCGDIQVIDLENCLAGNSCTAISSPPYRSGSDASWLSDGRVVYVERIFRQRGKNLTCNNGDITIADPLDLAIDPVSLFGGAGPLGWW